MNDSPGAEPETPQDRAEQALWQAHSSLSYLREKLVLLRQGSTTPRDRYALEDMGEWIDEAQKCLLQIDLMLNRRQEKLASARKWTPKKPRDRRRLPFRPPASPGEKP